MNSFAKFTIFIDLSVLQCVHTTVASLKHYILHRHSRLITLFFLKGNSKKRSLSTSCSWRQNCFNFTYSVVTAESPQTTRLDGIPENDFLLTHGVKKRYAPITTQRKKRCWQAREKWRCVLYVIRIIKWLARRLCLSADWLGRQHRGKCYQTYVLQGL